MKSFDYAAPSSVADVIGLLGVHPGAMLLAGGTDLLVQMRAARKQPDFVIDIKRVAEMNALHYDAAAGLTLGASVPCCNVYEDKTVRTLYPALTETAELIGGIQIQGRASIGGNLCNAAPSADSVPTLIALSAVANVAGPAGSRQIAVEDFCVAPGKNALAAGEILVSLSIPAPAAGSGAHYLRFIPRNEMDIAVAGVGASVVIGGGVFKAARVALASVAPTPLFVREAGESLVGKAVSDEAIEAAAELAKAAAKPITDMRGTAEYRKHLCAVLTRRALHTAVKRAQGVH